MGNQRIAGRFWETVRVRAPGPGVRGGCNAAQLHCGGGVLRYGDRALPAGADYVRPLLASRANRGTRPQVAAISRLWQDS